MPRFCIALVVAAALVPAWVAPAASGQQVPTFRSSVETVPIYATVTDGESRLLPDLERGEFQVFDNGRRQELSVFRNEVEPFSAVLLLDTSISMEANIPLVQDAAEQFVIRMLPDDRGAIAFFNSKITMSGQFTSNRDDLVSYIHDEVSRGNDTLLWDATDEAMSQLTGLAGRRVVVVLTDGDDWGSRVDRDEVVDRARRESVMLYAIGIESRFFNGQRWITTLPGSSLRRVAEETGGGYFELRRTADLSSTFTRVIQELHSQYVLGFSPATLDGLVHQLEVRTTRPGTRVRARQSYLAAQESSPDTAAPAGEAR